MASLYDIDSRIENIFVMEDGTAADKETGEILDAGTLENLQMERNQKIDNILCFIKNLEYDARGYREQQEYQRKRAERAEKKAAALKEYLTQHMEAGKKFESVHGEIGWRKSCAVEIPDVTALPEEFRSVKETWTADKNAIKKLLKSGMAVAGASLVERQNIQIK